MEKNHSIILGYGEEALTIIEEFINGRAKKIVLLSKSDTDAIKKRISFLTKKRKIDIIVRQGNPNIIENLRLLNIEKASSISIINDDDADSIKILLSLRMIARGDKNYNNKSETKINPMNICVLVNNRNSIELIKSIEDKDKFIIHIIYKYKILYKLIAQSIIYTGLSSVYEELFSYEGPDIKIESKHNHSNSKFIDVASKYLSNIADSKVLMGVIKKDKNLLYIPNSDYIIQSEDKLVILYTNYTENEKQLNISKHIAEETQQKNNILLICNDSQNNELIDIIKNYNKEAKITRMNYNEIDKENNKYKFVSNKLTKEDITKIILISEDIDTDVKAINTLLIIRQFITKENPHIPVLSLINSIENRELIKSDDIRDFIVSGNLIGMLMAHAAFNPDMLYVFEDLLSKNGKDIIIKKYKPIGHENKFIDTYLNLLYNNEIIIGYKKDDTIVLNPKPNENLTDEIIVITNNNINLKSYNN